MNWKSVVVRAAPLLFIIVFIAYFAGDGWGAIPSALVAWGTILLAFATFQLIKENRRMRAEEINRDFRSQSINGIIDWALALTNPRFKIPLVVTKKEPWILIPELEQLATRNIWVKEVAKSFERGFQDNVKKATEDLDSYVSALNRWHNHKCLLGEVTKSSVALEFSLKIVLKDAFRIKAEERL